MSGHPGKPDLRAALAWTFARRGYRGDIDRLARVLLGRRDDAVRARAPERDAVSIRPKVLDEVRRVLDETPDATPFAVCSSVPMRRQDVLAAVRVLRNGREPVPVDEEGAS